MCAHSVDCDFFDRKRPWSHIKDQVIGHYMPPYLCKVSKLGKRIILIDAFAGPGVYEEDQLAGLPCYGSPVIMCTEAQKHVGDNYWALFGNNMRKHHRKLVAELQKQKIPEGKAYPVLVNSGNLLEDVAQNMRDETILLYLDPFGIKGCEWEAILPFLNRSKTYSTEIIINLNVSGLPRLAAKHAVEQGRLTDEIRVNHQRLTDVLGGDWWQAILWSNSLSTREQAQEIVHRYSKQLQQFYPYTGFCPVSDKKGSRLKYFITFCSRHPDALKLHNDNMCDAYNRYIVGRNWDQAAFSRDGVPRRQKRATVPDSSGATQQLLPGFAGTRDWKDDVPREYDLLDKIILETVRKHNKKRVQPSREQVWLDIIMEPLYFMKWLESEYRDRVSKLILGNGKQLAFVDVRRTKRLNDASLLYTTDNHIC